MVQAKMYSRGRRVRKAYWVTFVVMLSYLRLYLFGKIFGTRYYSRKIIPLHLQNAERVKRAILQLEGLFIKVGQLLSILSNFLPEAFQKPLEALQDQVTPRPVSEIHLRIQSEFGKKTEDIFGSFEETPLASASIGQVHRARLKDGTLVAVKVQHANIEEIAKIDLQIMQRLIRLISRFMDIKGLDYAYTQVRKMIEDELDFAKEARSMAVIRKNLEGENKFIIPEVYHEFSTHRVLTTSFYQGVKISNTGQITRWKLDRREIANRLVHAYCQMVFVDGFYHADPHPGNILVQQDGTLILLDFGAVASLKPEMRTGFLDLIQAAAKSDTEKIISSLKALGFIGEGKETEKLAEKIIDAFTHFLQNEVQLDGLNFKDIKVNPFETSLFNLITDIGFRGISSTIQVPKDYVLLNRMVTLLLGICSTLDSQMNPLEVISPYFQDFIRGEKGELVKFITELLRSTITSTIALPGDLRKFLRQAQRGEIEIQTAGSKTQTQIIYVLGQQMIFSILLIAASGFSFWLYQSGERGLAQYVLLPAALFLLLLFRAMRMGSKLKKELK